MIQEIENKIKHIQEKLVLLTRKQAAMEKENAQLREALASSRSSASTAAVDMEAMRQQLDIAKYGNSPMQPEERKAFEKRINGYLREIDKCIALLSV